MIRLKIVVSLCSMVPASIPFVFLALVSRLGLLTVLESILIFIPLLVGVVAFTVWLLMPIQKIMDEQRRRHE